MPKRVLMLGNSELVIFKFRRELVERLRQEGWEVYVSFPQTVFGDGYKTAGQLGCHYINTPVSSHGTNPVADLRLLKFYREKLRQIQPQAVLTYTIKPNIYGALAAAKEKVPCAMNVSGLGTAVECPGPLQWVTLQLYRLAVKKVDCIFFQNIENETFFTKHRLGIGKHRLLPGSGVNLNQFQVLPYPKESACHFLFMARILKEKGIDQYLEAAQTIRKTHPNTVFHVLGVCDDPAYLARLKSLEQQGIIRYHGQQASVLPFQTISSCTVHPTYYPEGMSNVLLESAACGRPIITTDRSGCREIIEDGVNGFVCKRRDGADLIRQLEKFLALTREQRRNMGLAGRAKVEREFDRQLVVDAYLQEIQKAALQSAPRTKTSEEVVAHA